MSCISESCNGKIKHTPKINVVFGHLEDTIVTKPSITASQIDITHLYHNRYAVAEWYGAGLATARSRVRIPPVAAVYQRQLVPSHRGRLMSTSESWAYHTIHWPRNPWSCGFGWCPAVDYETEISAAPWALMLGKGLYFYTLSVCTVT